MSFFSISLIFPKFLYWTGLLNTSLNTFKTLFRVEFVKKWVNSFSEMNTVFRKMHKNILHIAKLLCFCSRAEFLHHRHIAFLIFQSEYLAPSKIRSHEVIFRHSRRALLSQPNAWQTSDFNSSAAQQDRLKPHTHTYTVPWFRWTVMCFPLPISQRQMERE